MPLSTISSPTLQEPVGSGTGNTDNTKSNTSANEIKSIANRPAIASFEMKAPEIIPLASTAFLAAGFSNSQPFSSTLQVTQSGCLISDLSDDDSDREAERYEAEIDTENILDDDPLYALWEAQHPDATGAEKALARRRRSREILENHRAEARSRNKKISGQAAAARMSLLSHISQRSAQGSIVSYSKLQRSGGNGSTSILQPGGLSTKSLSHRFGKEMDADTFEQRRLWHQFHDVDPSGTSFLNIRRQTVVPQSAASSVSHVPLSVRWQGHPSSAAAPAPLTTAELETELEAEAALTTWIAGLWRSSNHRHHEAATLIQCAVRGLIAKNRAQNERRRRAAELDAVMRNEERLEYMWNVELACGVSGGSHTVLERVTYVVRGFLSRFRAKMKRKKLLARRERQKQYEIMHFAACRIQACVRRFLARQAFRYRSIDGDTQEREFMIWAIPKTAGQLRGWLTRRRLRKMHEAALFIQTVYRTHLANVALHRAARERRLAEEIAMREYAVTVIQRFFRRHFEQRCIFLASKWRHFHPLLPMVGRGFLARKHVGLMLRARYLKYLIIAQKTIRRHQAVCRFNALKQECDSYRKSLLTDRSKKLLTKVVRAFMKGSTAYTTKVHEGAALNMQRIWRGVRARRWVRRVFPDECKSLVSMHAGRLNHDKKCCIMCLAYAERIDECATDGVMSTSGAAVKLQSTWRGYDTRKRLKHEQGTAHHLKEKGHQLKSPQFAKQQLGITYSSSTNYNRANGMYDYEVGSDTAHIPPSEHLLVEHQFRKKVAVEVLERSWQRYKSQSISLTHFPIGSNSGDSLHHRQSKALFRTAYEERKSELREKQEKLRAEAIAQEERYWMSIIANPTEYSTPVMEELQHLLNLAGCK